MDLDPREEKKCEYPYRDYYSTGGRYRPPKKRRSYGWLAAVVGLFLLCAAAFMTLDRRNNAAAAATRDLSPVAASAQTEPALAPPSEPASAPAAAVLHADGFRMAISDGKKGDLTLPEGFKAGVLSEDSVYDAIADLRDAAFDMLELGTDILKAWI